MGNEGSPLLLISQCQYGGWDKDALMGKLHDAHIELNQHAITLLSTDLVTSTEIKFADIYLASVQDLGFTDGATLSQVNERILDMGYRSCTLELAIYIRLMYTAQPAVNDTINISAAPAGSLTVLSHPLHADDEHPKGFYLRNIDGKLWLRGYRCSDDHVWSPNDMFLFRS